MNEFYQFLVDSFRDEAAVFFGKLIAVQGRIGHFFWLLANAFQMEWNLDGMAVYGIHRKNR